MNERTDTALIAKARFLASIGPYGGYAANEIIEVLKELADRLETHIP